MTKPRGLRQPFSRLPDSGLIKAAEGTVQLGQDVHQRKGK